MLFDPRVGYGELAGLCRRLATGLEAGLDVRRVCQREATNRARPALQSRLDDVSAAVARGSSLSEAFAQTGKYFPRLFRELVDVGEETGRMPEVFRQLAEHYEHQVKVKRIFLASISWPVLQLSAAVVVIGLVIWIMGFLPAMENGKPADILGLGLFGTSGLIVYLFFVGSVVAVMLLIYQGIRRGMAWTAPIQRLLLRLPGIGGPLETLALARLAWSLHLTNETGMHLLRALPLCLRSTHNAHYTDHTEAILRSVRSGNEISEAFAATGAFKREFIEMLAVGEQSGRLPETMSLLSSQYQDQARRAFATLTVLAGFAVWGLVAMIIILMIFRVAMFYINTITDAASGKF